jgi:hypothetical protein
MSVMNRRTFIQSLVAVFSMPAAPTLSIRAATAAVPNVATVAAVPAHARSWAIYISTLHGECTPQTLQNLLHIPASDAKNYVTQLIADGAIKSNPLLHKSVTELAKTKDRSLWDSVKDRLEMKAHAESEELETCKTIDAPQCIESDGELLEELPQAGLEVTPKDECAEAESQETNETESQSGRDAPPELNNQRQ